MVVSCRTSLGGNDQFFFRRSLKSFSEMYFVLRLSSIERKSPRVKFGGKNPLFISNNNGFDWQYINYYFHNLLGHNPFGHSSTNLGSLYKGVVRDVYKNFKHLRKTAHTHCPVDDAAMGNAEAMLIIQQEYDLKIGL